MHVSIDAYMLAYTHTSQHACIYASMYAYMLSPMHGDGTGGRGSGEWMWVGRGERECRVVGVLGAAGRRGGWGGGGDGDGGRGAAAMGRRAGSGGDGDCWEAAGMGRMAGAAASGCGRGEERRSVGWWVGRNKRLRPLALWAFLFFRSGFDSSLVHVGVRLCAFWPCHPSSSTIPCCYFLPCLCSRYALHPGVGAS